LKRLNKCATHLKKLIYTQLTQHNIHLNEMNIINRKNIYSEILQRKKSK